MPALGFDLRPVRHSFTLEVVGIDVSKDGFEDALYEAGLGDALVLVDGDRLLLDVDRAAPSFEKAVSSAKDDVMRAGGDVVAVQRIED